MSGGLPRVDGVTGSPVVGGQNPAEEVVASPAAKVRRTGGLDVSEEVPPTHTLRVLLDESVEREKSRLTRARLDVYKILPEMKKAFEGFVSVISDIRARIAAAGGLGLTGETDWHKVYEHDERIVKTAVYEALSSKPVYSYTLYKPSIIYSEVIRKIEDAELKADEETSGVRAYSDASFKMYEEPAVVKSIMTQMEVMVPGLTAAIKEAESMYDYFVEAPGDC